MGFVFELIVLLILGGLFFIGGRVVRQERLALNQRRGQTGGAGVGNFVSYGGVALVVLLGIFATFHASTKTIEPGHIGIVKQFGSYKGTLGNGFKTKSPFASVNVVSVKDELRTYEMDDKAGDAGAAVSSDSQPVYLTVQVRYQLQQDKAVSLYIKTGGSFVERILDPAVFQYTKETTAKFKAVEFAKNREEIRQEIERSLNVALQPDGILVKNVTLKNVDFTDALSSAIEQTVEAEQLAKRAQAQVAIKQAEARQSVATAEGEAKSAIATATGVARSNIIEAQAEAKANKLRTNSLTQNVLQHEAIEKLNPNVEVILCPADKICIPNGAGAVLGSK